ncbi:uncharacterized protein LOC132034423 [Lycium ferocissimum]|uniref:uncharacterized protein LOC132034423 n=1 Tax=Lycium ferocissimum TaxID=112874 RepID=UPI002814DCEB|nr:uncharacterized protein LOC132034423 [Lycium ferocissimum]XP_059280756.1 uncharacterized protein LOC132034423 [Lycium ferocissimum]
MPVEMDEAHQATQDAQAATGDDQEAADCDIGSTSRDTQEFTQASSMTYQPTNTQIVLYMTPQTPQYSRDPSLSSLELDDIEGIELDDANDEVDGNDLEDASDACDFSQVTATIQHGEPSIRPKCKNFRKRCATGSHFLDQHGRMKKQRGKSKKTER